MAYFGTSQRMVGDPGFFGTLGKIAKGAIGGAIGFATGGVGGAIRGSGILGGGRMPSAPTFAPPTIGGRIRTAGQALVPGGVEPFRKRRRRMNPMNKKALTRANRRIDGFVRETKKVLKHTNYKLVSKSSASRRPRRDLGRGHEHVR